MGRQGRGLLCAAALLVTLWSMAGFANHCRGSNSCSEYLVRFSPRASEKKIGAILRREALMTVEYFDRSEVYHLVGHPGQAKGQVLRRLNSELDVIYAEPNLTVYAEGLPSDPLFSELWGLRNVGQSGGTAGADIGMEEVWNSLTGSSRITVAILDTGIDYRHEDLRGNIWTNVRETPGNGRDDDGNGLVDDFYGYNFYGESADPMDDDFHGTHVAGTVGASGDNGIGITGVNWDVKLMAIKVLGSTGSGSLSDIIRGIDYAVDNGAKVINASWGFLSASDPSQALRDAIAAADQAGVIFVASAGNNSLNVDQNRHYPSGYELPNILSVAATNRSDVMASFSNYGATTVDLGAPGVSILSTYPSFKDRLYAYASGTSMAAPHVAGAAALLWSANAALGHRQVIEQILSGVQPDPYLQGKTVTGGRLDVARSAELGVPQSNHPPIANAGPSQTKIVGQIVALNGSAVDQDGDAPLLFEWTLSRPSGSQAALNSGVGQQVSFVPDVAGTYRATLVVSDGESSSLLSTATISVSGSSTTAPPSISIRMKRNGLSLISTQIQVGDLISLDGSGSRSFNGQALTYRWAFVERPTGSATLLNNASSAVGSFRPDREGRYTVRLTVSDGKLSSSGEVSLWANPLSSVQPPKISIRLSRNGFSLSSAQVQVGDLIGLDASASTSNGGALTFLWSFAAKPTGSAAAIANPTSPLASFRPDKTGYFIVNLTVGNGTYSAKGQIALSAQTPSSSAVAAGSFESEDELEPEGDFLPPNAAIEILLGREPLEMEGQGFLVPVGENLSLDGRSSSPGSGESLSFHWELFRKPDGSQAEIKSPEEAEIALAPDFPGRYMLSLTVDDGISEAQAEISILAQTPRTGPDSE